MLMPDSPIKRWFVGTALFLMIPMSIVYGAVDRPRTVYWAVVLNCLMYVGVIAFVTFSGKSARTQSVRPAVALVIVVLASLAFAAPLIEWLIYVYPIAWLSVLAASLAHRRKPAP